MKQTPMEDPEEKLVAAKKVVEEMKQTPMEDPAAAALMTQETKRLTTVLTQVEMQVVPMKKILEQSAERAKAQERIKPVRAKVHQLSKKVEDLCDKAEALKEPAGEAGEAVHETEAKAKAATLKETQATLSKEIDAAVRELSTFRFSHEQVIAAGLKTELQFLGAKVNVVRGLCTEA